MTSSDTDFEMLLEDQKLRIIEWEHLNLWNVKNVGVTDCLRNDGLEKRLTLGLRVFRAVYKVDGIMGFYRGFLSSLLLYIPSSMIFWSTYYNALNLLTELDKKFSTDKSEERNLLKLQATSGAIGGITAAALTNPLEVLRIRIQVHRTGYVETFRRLMVFEGARVFTKGLAPRVINNGIYSFLIMLGYESVKRIAIKDELSGSVTW
uniref:Mitochondrial carrier protein n=1 Tax=Panagrolaimus sp. ES5 TaxID=591445 RepID=A0AC34FYR6_9BILA